MISLTRRITLGTVALTAVVVGIAGLLVWTASYWQAVRAMDTELGEHAQRFRLMTKDPPPHLETPGDGGGTGGQTQRPPWMRKPPLMPGHLIIQISEAETGREVLPTNEAGGDILAMLQVTPSDEPTWLRLADGTRVRGLWLTSRPPAGPALSAAIGVIATATLQELHRLAVVLGVVWLTASILAVLAAWWLRRSVIGPVHRLVAAIRAITPGSTRAGIKAVIPQEMEPITLTLNELLERQAALLAREKTAIANIAHELRSPISGLRTTLEVADLDPSTTAKDLVDRCMPTVVAMQSMVVNLLALARLEAGHEQVVVELVPLEDLFTATWDSLSPLAQQRHQSLQRVGDLGQVRTCRDKVTMILGNLLDNALTYAPPDSVIQIQSEVSDGCRWLRIINTIEGAPPDPARIFEPLWRGDQSRTTQQHCGLGMALVQRLAILIGAKVRVEVLGDRFIAHLGLPIAN